MTPCVGAVEGSSVGLGVGSGVGPGGGCGGVGLGFSLVSSSVMVVVTDEVASESAGPPPPEGLEMATEKSLSDSSKVSSVVCTVKLLASGDAWVKVSVPDADV